MNEKNKNLEDNYTPFPIELLPRVVGEFVEEVVKSNSCAPEFVVLPLLSCLGAAVGNSANMKPKSDWNAPSVFWTVTVGESGTGKSPTFKDATDFIVLMESEAYESCMDSNREYEAKKNLWDKKSGESAPEPPNCDRYYIEDTTTEALMSVLENNPSGVMVINDELSGWFASFDRYAKRGSGGDVAKWLKLWDARPVSIDRKTGDTRHLRIEKPIVGIAGAIQPSVLWKAVESKNVENGLLARFLIAYPPAEPQTWQEIEPSEASRQAMVQLFESLYEWNFASTDEKKGTADLVFDEEARKSWIDFFNNNQKLVSDSTAPLSYAFAKLDQYCLRFACLYHMIENCEKSEIPTRVSQATLEAAIKTTEWFREEARRVYKRVMWGGETERLNHLRKKIADNNFKMSVRDLQRTNSKKYPTADHARADLQTLVDFKEGDWSCPDEKLFRSFGDPLPRRDKLIGDEYDDSECLF